jgi:TPR repeat protein
VRHRPTECVIHRLLVAFGIAPVLALMLVATAHAEKRVALVIGNDRYANLPADRQLARAVNDAQAVGNALERLGFQVIRGADLSRQGMIDKLSELTSRLQAGDTAAFFYAGHGVAIGGVNYLVPTDVPAVTEGAEARVRGASVSEGDVVAEIQSAGARVALLVLDACRDNPFPRSATRSIGNTRGLTEAQPARGIFTIYSAGIGQTALDGLEPNDPNRNSVFTRVFVEKLAQPGLDLGGLAVEVRERVAELALNAKDESGRPAPHEQTPAYYDQTIGGRVFLSTRAIAVEPATMPKPSSDVVVTPAPAPATKQNAGSDKGLTYLAIAYETGDGVPKDEAKAARLYKQASDVGDAQATLNLGAMYYEGRGVAKNYAEALVLFRKAASLGDAQAMTNLGVMYGAGQGVLKDNAQSLHWLEQAADRGSSSALTFLAIRYEEGNGVVRNESEAARLYRKAVDLGNDQAMLNLGKLFYEGQGVAKDYAQALRLFRQAAERGNAQAMTNIGVMYQNGQAVPKDRAEAARWFMKAAQQRK